LSINRPLSYGQRLPFLCAPGAYAKKDLYQKNPGKGLARQISLTNGTGLAGVLTMPLL
jgi:hypothetical protein